jgi:uncharacterized OsmC-like protein
MYRTYKGDPVRLVSATAVGTGSRSRISVGGREVVTDEAKNLSSGEPGASPLSTLLSSLIGCKQATFMSFAHKAKVPVQKVCGSSVRVVSLLITA